jgi:hypothetical protein
MNDEKYLVLYTPGECTECASREEVVEVLVDWPDAEVIIRGPNIANSFDKEVYRHQLDIEEAQRDDELLRATFRHSSRYI